MVLGDLTATPEPVVSASSLALRRSQPPKPTRPAHDLADPSPPKLPNPDNNADPYAHPQQHPQADDAVGLARSATSLTHPRPSPSAWAATLTRTRTPSEMPPTVS
jgi:hypothetical protein